MSETPAPDRNPPVATSPVSAKWISTLGAWLVILTVILVWMLVTRWPQEGQTVAERLSEAVKGAANAAASVTNAEKAVTDATAKIQGLEQAVTVATAELKEIEEGLKVAEKAATEAQSKLEATTTSTTDKPGVQEEVNRLKAGLTALKAKEADKRKTLEKARVEEKGKDVLTKAESTARVELEKAKAKREDADSERTKAEEAVKTPDTEATKKEDGTPQSHYIFIVVILGALGAQLHALASFMAFVGNREFVKSWTAWYLLRPFQGALLALIVYAVLRGSVLGMSNGITGNFWGMAAFCLLAGLFSKQATAKLGEVFDVMFRVNSPKEKDGLRAQAAPELKNLDPASIAKNSVTQDKPQVVKLTGTGFTVDSKVLVSNKPKPARFTSSSELQITLTMSDLAEISPGKVAVFVRNESPAGKSDSKPVDLILT